MRAFACSAVLLVATLVWPIATHAEDGASFCGGCQFMVGVGGTYHFWSRTHGIVFPFGLDLDGNRYELGVFRMATEQTLESLERPPAHKVASPYWGASLSRRWEPLGNSYARFFAGLGFSYKSETDELNSTHWNFALQLGVRFRLNDGRQALELAVRHWSNAGLKLPNRGQDFATVTFAF